MECTVDTGDRPAIMVTNDDGIDAPGLRALVRVLVSANRFVVRVCAPDSNLEGPCAAPSPIVSANGQKETKNGAA
ncbi:survival protein SurE-like phosphatase/nucleotidase [Actinidia rufa]|uniref:Survival protein SurE-like phosphatase/nucleotidase n=1 Tax=Actinidia rufa TaxID=165716 RepID=A0A7J0DJR4_9ERIC|nr:survival protein SurE-like phosphatase/nucleotidase [Actinidia rufa]